MNKERALGVFTRIPAAHAKHVAVYIVVVLVLCMYVVWYVNNDAD